MLGNKTDAKSNQTEEEVSCNLGVYCRLLFPLTEELANFKLVEVGLNGNFIVEYVILVTTVIKMTPEGWGCSSVAECSPSMQ
jgi:hypothetical protein